MFCACYVPQNWRLMPWRLFLLGFTYGAACLAFFWPFQRPFHTPKLVILGVLALVLAMGRRSHSGREWAWCLMWLWPLATVFWMVNPLDYGQAAMMVLATLALWLWGTPLQPDEKTILGKTVALSAVAAAAYGVVQFLGWDPVTLEEGAGAGSFFGNPNFAAHFLLLSLGLGRFDFGRARWPALILVVLAIGLTESRGAWLGTVLWFWLRPWPQASNRYRVGSGAFAILLLAAMAWVFRSDIRQGSHYLVHPGAYVDEYQQQPPLFADRDPWFRGKRLSLMVRYLLWTNTLPMVADHGPAGAGLGQFEVAYARYANEWVSDVNFNHHYRATSAHNLILDSASQLGIIWTVVFGLFVWRCFVWSWGDPTYQLALALQLGIAFFSLNYLNPMIVCTLLLFLPRKEAESETSWKRFGVWLCAVPVFLMALVDTGPLRVRSHFYPQEVARDLYDQGRLRQAFAYQLKAFEQDPHGPETIFNLGLMAWEIGQEEGESWRDLAILAWGVNRGMHPHYEPARLRLESIGQVKPPRETEWRRHYEQLELRLQRLKNEGFPD